MQAPLVEGIYSDLSDLDIRRVVVVAADSFGQLPTAAYCKATALKYGFTGPVVYDPSGQILALTSASNLHLVTDAALVNQFVANYPLLTDVEAALTAAATPAR